VDIDRIRASAGAATLEQRWFARVIFTLAYRIWRSAVPSLWAGSAMRSPNAALTNEPLWSQARAALAIELVWAGMSEIKCMGFPSEMGSQ
jgi:hypothetical protein